MTDTIESFVNRLQKEGIESGQAEAKNIAEQAQKQAAEILADAEKKAQQIIADAESRGKQIVDHANSEMTLAARDTVAKLRDTLAAGLKQILTKAVSTTLQDADFIKGVLQEIVALYAKADISSESCMTINVTQEMQNTLSQWAINQLGQALGDKGPELKGGLNQAGFEYEISGGTVEVTQDAVVEILSEMVTPALRDALAATPRSS